MLSASLKGHATVVRALSRVGARVDQPRQDGVTAVWLASQAGHGDVVKILCEAEADAEILYSGATPLYIASASGHAEVVHLLCKIGVDKDKGLLDATPLYIAAQNGHLDVVRVLCREG